ncbi:hypothetical protein [Haloferula sp.]|uniref:hypothetical protein n=1 Tax=Haloferula sp. TaxID=2497595 RepID=UPI003C749489
MIVPYDAPTIIGTTVPAVGIPAQYQVSRVAGATSYDWRKILETSTPNDPAETLERVTPLVESSSPMLSDVVKFKGSRSYHLFHENFADNALLYNSAFQVAAGAELTFRSRHAYATAGQVATVQVREDGEDEWKTAWSQAGKDNAGENSFRLVNVPLDAYEGQRIQLRLLYDYISGSAAYFYTLGVPVGWYVDEIVFVGLATVSEETIASADAEGNFEFTPEAADRYRLSSRPVFPDRTGSFGDSLPVDASIQNTFGDWASANEAALELPVGGLSGDPEGDLNGDGVANVMAYALGLDPMTPAAHRLPRAEHDGGQIVITYQSHSQRSDVTWGPEATDSLQSWAAPGDPSAPAGFADEILNVNGATLTRRAVLPISPGNSGYLRMKAAIGGRTGP